MAIFLLACKEMATRMKKLDLDGSSSLQALSADFIIGANFNGNLMVSNNILAFFCRLIKFYFTTVYTEVCISKPLIVAYVFSVQYFENTTIVAYVGLRVKPCT